MEAALRVLLPRLLGDTSFEVHPYQCKNDLLKRLPERFRGYSSWLPTDWRIVVIMDRDDDDCHTLKRRLEQSASDAGLRTRTVTGSSGYQVVNRLAIEELEAWYFGDWGAVKGAYPRVPDGIPRQAKFRDPDRIRGGTWEAFERVLQRAGYFRSGLRKIEAARAVAERWNPDSNRSKSFVVFRDVVREMAAR
ncbi:MAG: DUF4276 family protein [Phycisphaerae bacterium]|nr:DUF4276 family protein [Phycisphaerae bacterium]